MRIIDIQTRHYKIPDSLKVTTRSEDEPESYDIHTVTLDFGDSNGFAILSDTPGIDQVFYYTETGCIADTAKIYPMKDMVESFPQIAANILVKGKEQVFSTTRSTQEVNPLVEKDKKDRIV